MDFELLRSDRLAYWCQRIGMPAGATEALEAVRVDVLADPALLALFEQFHTSTALEGQWRRDWKPLEFNPLVTELFGQRASMFYLLAYMAAIPHLEQYYVRKGIDLQIMIDTLWDIPFYTLQATDVHGYWRFDQFMWIWRHLAGELFRLGRLQFILHTFDGHVTALRKKTDGTVLLLADPDRILRADGYALGAGQTDDKPATPEEADQSWNPVFEESKQGWHGHPISPYGYVIKEPVTLLRNEWQVALKDGDTVLDLHIPRDTTLAEEDCRNSFRQAFDFFAQHFPERPFKGVYCHTWLFSPQLQTLLRPDSAIVHFQREFYLYPHPGGPGFMWNFVFGEKYPDRANAPRDTSLRRAALDWLEDGKPIFDLPGVMLHSPEEWGTQPYMSAWDRQQQAQK